jgi:hypothetical protein
MNEFAEWKVGKKNADKKDVNIEKDAHIFRHYGIEINQPQRQLFDADNVDLDDITHQDARLGDTQDQEKGKVIGGQGNIAYLWDQKSSKQQKRNGCAQEQTALVRSGKPKLKKAVDIFDQFHKPRQRIFKEAKVPDQYDEETIMESNSADPEPFG